MTEMAQQLKEMGRDFIINENERLLPEIKKRLARLTKKETPKPKVKPKTKVKTVKVKSK